MPLGINATQNITIEDVSQILNFTNPTDLLININHDVYGGWLFFVLLLLTWVVLYFMYSMVENEIAAEQILNNIMYSGAIVSVLSLLLRGIYVYRLGVLQGLISDWQMWMFPLVTLLIAVVVWMTKE